MKSKLFLTLFSILATSIVASIGASIGAAVATAADASGQSWASVCTDWDGWDKPAPPFQIFGNSYYVGTCGIASILIVGSQGHILIDGGTAVGAPLIAANIRELGFDLADLKLLLHSHGHFDHVGGLAELQALSGATVLASKLAAPVLKTGAASSADPQFGLHAPFPAVAVGGLVEPGRTIAIGELELVPLSTPGHSPGALSWQWSSCEKERCLDIVYADSLSPISSKAYRFSSHPSYLGAYRAGLSKLRELNCDLLLTPHPSASNMPSRLRSPQGLIDNNACEAYTKKVSSTLDKRLAKEQVAKDLSEPN